MLHLLKRQQQQQLHDKKRRRLQVWNYRNCWVVFLRRIIDFKSPNKKMYIFKNTIGHSLKNGDK